MEEAAFKIVEGALEAAKGLADAALSVAQATLTTVQLGLRAAQVLVDAASAIIETMAKLVNFVVQGLLKLFHIDDIGIGGRLSLHEVEVQFKLSGMIFGQHFDLGFKARLNFDHIFSSIMDAMADKVRSLFGGGHSHKGGGGGGGSGENVTTTTPIFNGKTLLTLYASTGSSSSSSSDSVVGGIAYNYTADFHHRNVYANPLLNSQDGIEPRSTNYVTVPPMPFAEGVMDDVCAKVNRSLAGMVHSAATIDLSGLPPLCKVTNVTNPNITDTVHCYTYMLNTCFLPGLELLHERRSAYQDMQASGGIEELIATHQSVMGPEVEFCSGAVCKAMVHDIATKAWTILLDASSSSANSELPELPDNTYNGSSVLNISYHLAFSDAGFYGAIPQTYNQLILNSLALGGNNITSGVENVANNLWLEYLDLSDNPLLQLSPESPCVSDALSHAPSITAYNFQNCPLVAAGFNSSTRCNPIADEDVGFQVVIQLSDASMGELNVTNYCANCDPSLQPFGCLGLSCADFTTQASLKRKFLDDVAAAMSAASVVSRRPEPVDAALLSID